MDTNCIWILHRGVYIDYNYYFAYIALFTALNEPLEAN